LCATRQQGEAVAPGAVLPALGDMSARLSAAAAAWVGPPAGDGSQRLTLLIVEPLHAEIDEVLHASAAGGEGGSVASDRVSRVFRVWRTEKLKPLAIAVLQSAAER